MRGRAGLMAAALGAALIPGLVAAQDATPTTTDTPAPSETPTPPPITPPAIDRDAPRHVSARLDTDSGAIIVSWEPAEAGPPEPASYTIERSRTGGLNQPRTYTAVATIEAGPNPSYRDTDTASPGQYCYRIRANWTSRPTSEPSAETCVMRPVIDFFPPTPGAPDTGSGVANQGGASLPMLGGVAGLFVAGVAGLAASRRRR